MSAAAITCCTRLHCFNKPSNSNLRRLKCTKALPIRTPPSDGQCGAAAQQPHLGACSILSGVNELGICQSAWECCTV